MTNNHLRIQNLLFFSIVLIFFWFGVIFYDLIQIKFGFSYTDELTALFFFLYIVYFKIKTKDRIDVVSLVVLAILTFYFIYSLSINSNSYKAIISDLVVIAKPFIAFLFVWEINPQFSGYMRKILSVNILIASLYIAGVGLSGNPAILNMFSHYSRLATASIISALLYLFLNKFNKKTVILFTIILSISLLSSRSKAYGFFPIAILPLGFFYRTIANNTFKFRKRYAVFFLILFGLMLYSAWPKIHYYCVTGTKNPAHMFARPALYLTSVEIAKDYFPFGSGLASFASHFSAKYYSSIYHRYNLDHLRGLSKAKPSFISDSFFPQVLGQFGFAGLLLFIGGLILAAKNSYRWYLKNNSGANYLYMIYCILACIGIESVADSTLVQNRGMFIVMLLGLAMQKLRHPMTDAASKSPLGSYENSRCQL